MNFWEFLDKQIGRLRPDGVAGAGIFGLTCYVLSILAEKPELADNDLFKTLSQALVVQGLVGLAMAAWFTKRASSEAQPVEVRQPANNPIPVQEKSPVEAPPADEPPGPAKVEP